MVVTAAACSYEVTAGGAESALPDDTQVPQPISSAGSAVKGAATKLKKTPIASRKVSKAEERDRRP